MKNVKITLLIVLLLFQLTSDGQINEYRFGISIEKRLFKSLKLELSPNFRLSDNSTTREYILNGGLFYKPIKYLDFGIVYRFNMMETDGLGSVYQNNIYLSSQLHYSITRLNLAARVMATNDGESGLFESQSNNYIRYRFKARYNIKSIKVNPIFSVEYFYQINDKEFNKSRFSLGFEYKLTKSHAIELEYTWQDYLKKDKSLNIFALNYHFSF